MKNVIGNFNQNLRTQIKNPILAYFAATWIVINWKLVYYLIFSDKSTFRDNLFYIETHFSDMGHLFYQPLMYTVLLIILLSVLNIPFQFIKELCNLVVSFIKLSTDTTIANNKKKLVIAEANAEIEGKIKLLNFEKEKANFEMREKLLTQKELELENKIRKKNQEIKRVEAALRKKRT